MSETLANAFYFSGNLNSPAPHQAFCGNLGSINESVCKSL